METQSLGDRLRKELAHMADGTVALVENPVEMKTVAAMRDMDKEAQFRCLVLAQAMVDGLVSDNEVEAASKAGRDALLALADRLAEA